MHQNGVVEMGVLHVSFTVLSAALGHVNLE